jgi:hypothetical protein
MLLTLLIQLLLQPLSQKTLNTLYPNIVAQLQGVAQKWRGRCAVPDGRRLAVTAAGGGAKTTWHLKRDHEFGSASSMGDAQIQSLLRVGLELVLEIWRDMLQVFILASGGWGSSGAHLQAGGCVC